MKHFYLTLLFILLVGAACGPSMTGDEVAEPDAVSDAAIIYNRSGGFAGVQQEWMIYPDGRIEFPDGSQKQVDSAQAQALFETIQSANFQSLNASYVPEDACCDLFTYTVTLQAGDETYTVTTMDEAPNEPAALTAVRQTIDELIQSAE